CPISLNLTVSCRRQPVKRLGVVAVLRQAREDSLRIKARSHPLIRLSIWPSCIPLDSTTQWTPFVFGCILFPLRSPTRRFGGVDWPKTLCHIARKKQGRFLAGQGDDKKVQEHTASSTRRQSGRTQDVLVETSLLSEEYDARNDYSPETE